MTSTSATSNTAFISEARPFLFVFKAGLQQPAQTTQQQQSDTSVATQAELAPASCTSSTSISSTAPEEFEGSSSDLQKRCSYSDVSDISHDDSDDESTITHDSHDENVIGVDGDNESTIGDGYHAESIISDDECCTVEAEDVRYTDASDTSSDNDDHDTTISDDSINHECTISDDDYESNGHGDLEPDHASFDDGSSWDERASDISDDSFRADDLGDGGASETSAGSSCDDGEGWEGGAPDISADSCCDDGDDNLDECASDISSDSYDGDDEALDGDGGGVCGFSRDDDDDDDSNFDGSSDVYESDYYDNSNGFDGSGDVYEPDYDDNSNEFDSSSDVDEVEYYHVIDDASDFEEPKYTSAVSFEFVDLSSATVELEPVGPPPELTPTECLTHLPTAVGLCPPNKPEIGLKVFKWGAKAICGVVIESYLAGGDPFEDGGIMQTAAAPAIVKLAKIRKEYQEDFDDECISLDFAIEDLCEELARVPWSAKPVEDLGSTPPTPSARGVVELDSTPSPSASSSTPSASASTTPASASASAAVYQQDTASTSARAPTTSPASICSAAAEEEGEEMSFEVPCTPGAVMEDDGGGGGGGMDMVFGIRDSCAGLVVEKPSCRAGPVTADDDDDGGDVDLDDMDIVDQQRGPMGMFEASVVQGEGLAYGTSFLPTVCPAEDCDDNSSNAEKSGREEEEEEEEPVIVRSVTFSAQRGDSQVLLSRVAEVVEDAPVTLVVPPIKVTNCSEDSSEKRSEKNCGKKMEKKPGEKSEKCLEKKCEMQPEKRFDKMSDTNSDKNSTFDKYSREKSEKISDNKYKKRSEKKSGKIQTTRLEKHSKRKTDMRSEKSCLGVVDYVARRTRSSPGRPFANRTARVSRAKSSKVKAGEAELRAGIG
eukprot:jgi/Undpi1/2901/HiC_scaffold_14.g06278.m1